jgi:hypothetical protein
MAPMLAGGTEWHVGSAVQTGLDVLPEAGLVHLFVEPRSSANLTVDATFVKTVHFD